VLDDVHAGDRVFFDDGKIGGTVEVIDAEGAHCRITRARPKGSVLRADKGINLPDSSLRLPALGAKDRADLMQVVRLADIVALSFVQRPEDVAEIEEELARLEARDIGLVLKIETRRGFAELPNILLAAIGARPLGVMIARGDMAVECGYERLAEIQEEMLWLCESAHVPVIWATEVLDRLSRKGLPTRAEITDAAMSERAECVMLNKGPYVLEAISLLDRILRRMEGHQYKKIATLRPLAVAKALP
jgi:pyruvate kinase